MVYTFRAHGIASPSIVAIQGLVPGLLSSSIVIRGEGRAGVWLSGHRSRSAAMDRAAAPTRRAASPFFCPLAGFSSAPSAAYRRATRCGPYILQHQRETRRGSRIVTIDFPMVCQFRPIRKEAVMCTVQGCTYIAAFVFTGEIDWGTGGHSVVAAYCDHHAEDAATRLGHQWPIPDRRPQDPPFVG